jgi:mycothiol S-conjugate amidase
MDAPLSLLSIHAHPDDESSKGAGTVAKYHAEGVRTTLVCCTGGEAGDILNPAMDTDEVKADIGKVRRAELDRAAEIIGYDEVVMLGYRDSGMPDSEANQHPDCFANADLDEAVGRIVAVIRRVRPQVILSYGDERDWYPHPDHLRVHEVTQPAVDRAADPDWYPELGDPWQVSKIYHSTWSRARFTAMHEKFLELGLESPFDDSRWNDRPSQDHLITTRIPIEGFAHVRLDALLAHATQIDPNSPFWFGLPREVAVTVHPYDDYVRDMSLVDAPTPEDDLFAGVRDHVGSST